jgi:predicted RNase H-like HicB family nuclease
MIVLQSSGPYSEAERRTNAMREYFAVIFQDSDMTFSVTFPDLPGCVATATTIEEARAAAARVLARRLADMKRTGDPIPAPSTLEVIVGGEDEHCGSAILVREAANHD